MEPKPNLPEHLRHSNVLLSTRPGLAGWHCRPWTVLTVSGGFVAYEIHVTRWSFPLLFFFKTTFLLLVL